MNSFLYLFFGLVPSLIWLSFYLRKDTHPEPKKMVLKVFFLGMGAAILAALIESLISQGLSQLNGSQPLIQIGYIFLGVALIEELLKYFAVEKKYVILKNGILKESEFDEPLDLMLYMIISALGFAALENILIFFSKNLPLFETLLISSLRFIGATFLHALCSGTFGFFLALSFFERKKRLYLFSAGLTIATLLHGIFNYSIIKIESSLMVKNGSVLIADFNLFVFSFVTLIITLIGLALFVSWGFKKLKKLKSICKVD